MGARRIAVAFALLFATGAAVGCENEPPKTALGYTESAKRAYDAAMAEFNAHNWLEAQSMMREVKRKYSYSRQARLAELRIADADYEQEKYSDAIREYKDFVHEHRSDEEDLAYARSRIAETTYKEIPESFLSPASEERDQASVLDAYKEMRAYLADYANSKESNHIRDLLGDIIARLIRHELYVARFYLNKENYDATIARIQYALHNYAPAEPGLGGAQLGAGHELAGQAFILLGETYLRMHKWPEARDAFEAAFRNNPRSATAIIARNYLDEMKGRGV